MDETINVESAAKGIGEMRKKRAHYDELVGRLPEAGAAEELVWLHYGRNEPSRMREYVSKVPEGSRTDYLRAAVSYLEVLGLSETLAKLTEAYKAKPDAVAELAAFKSWAEALNALEAQGIDADPAKRSLLSLSDEGGSLATCNEKLKGELTDSDRKYQEGRLAYHTSELEKYRKRFNEAVQALNGSVSSRLSGLRETLGQYR